MFEKRLNQVFALGGNKISVAVEFTYCMYGLAAATISFLIVKQSVNFAFYFFVMTRAASKDTSGAWDQKKEGQRYTIGTLIKLLYAILITSVIVIMLFIHEVTGTLIVDTMGLNPLYWNIIRAVIVLGIASLRIMTYKEELQFQFDQSYYIISRMV